MPGASGCPTGSRAPTGSSSDRTSSSGARPTIFRKRRSASEERDIRRPGKRPVTSCGPPRRARCWRPSEGPASSEEVPDPRRATTQLGVSGWIIQDGNYGEFEAGREYRFALEFGSLRLVVDTEPVSEPRLSLVGSAIYEARGVIVFRSDSAWAVEFGIPAYEEGKAPAWASVGDPIRGRVYLGVDPSSSTERRKDVTGMPELIRTWFVRR